MTSTVYLTPGSIGYVEQAYSQGLLLPFAEIRNQVGNYVLPTPQTIAAAAGHHQRRPPGRHLTRVYSASLTAGLPGIRRGYRQSQGGEPAWH